MAIPGNIRIANDNAPKRLAALQQVGSSEAMSVKGSTHAEPSPELSQNIPKPLKSAQRTDTNNSTRSLHLTIACWVAAALFMLATFSLGFGTGPKIFASIALLWAGLWSSYIAADHGRWRFSEMSVVTALMGLMGAITTTVNYFGVGLTLTDGLVLMSTLPLIIGYLLKSRICVLASICASLIWGALGFSGLSETSNVFLIFPLICAAQIFTGTKIRSGMAITLAVITGYYWVSSFIFTAWSAGNLPLTFAAAALFILGTAHHRSGKAAEDKRLTGSSIHIYTGWIAAIIGAVGFQYFWLNPEAVQSSTSTLSISGLTMWKGVILTSLAVVICSTIIRYKHSQTSLAGIFLLTGASAIIPMMLWFPSWPQAIISEIPGMSAMPTIGILIGAAITATALGMTLNGVRRHSAMMMFMGISALMAQAFMLLKPEIITAENGIIFVVGCLVSLAVGATIAGSSLSYQAPAPRLKHA